jgi:signal transduction histidine kinase
MLSYVKKSLSKRILAVLTLSVALIMLGVVYLTYSFETQEMLRTIDMNSEETASAIYAGIKYPMSLGDSGAVEKELIDIKEHTGIDIFIVNTKRSITFSSRKELIRSDLGAHITSKVVLDVVGRALQDGQTPARGYMQEWQGRKSLVHIHAISNQQECYRCHGPEKKVLGVIISMKSAERNYAAVVNMRNTNIIVSFLGICAIITIAHTLLVRLVSQPIKALVNDIRHLPEQISKDSFASGVNITREDQIGVLQKSFSEMAVDIYEKNHALAKTNAKLENAYQELEAFAYSVSHDLRAPLRNIDGFSKILLDEFAETLDERAQHYLRRVRNGTERMSRLIDDMLAFSRIGRAEFQFKRISCAELVKVILEYYATDMEKRQVKVIVQALPEINGDPVLMQSVFANLISNAFKYSRGIEHPEIIIGYDKDKKAIFVKDNGIGFEMKYHDKVFQVFQRLHLPEEYEGTGIGLAIVKRIVERHRGRIWAESEPGLGTVFYMDLPIFKEV